MSKPATMPQIQHLMKLFQDIGVSSARLQLLFKTGLLADLCRVRDPSKIDRKQLLAVLTGEFNPQISPVDVNIDDLPSIDPDAALAVAVSKSGVELLRYFGIVRDAGWERMDYPEFDESWGFPGCPDPIIISLFKIERQLTTRGLYCWMQREGYRPAKLYELAALGQSPSKPPVGIGGSEYLSLDRGVLRNRTGIPEMEYPSLGLDQESYLVIGLTRSDHDLWSPGYTAVGVKVFP